MEDTGNIVIYESEGGDVRLDVRLENETVWLTQQQISLLYGKSISTINEHIGDIIAGKELLWSVERNSEIPNFSRRHPTIITST